MFLAALKKLSVGAPTCQGSKALAGPKPQYVLQITPHMPQLRNLQKVEALRQAQY